MRKIPVYNHPAAGWTALVESAGILMDYQAFLRGSYSVLSSNQPVGGFDCPGCAWPDHKTHKSIDVCESGIKVLASETTAKLADANFFANHTVKDLQTWSGYELDQAGRLAEPLKYDADQDTYVPIPWDKAFSLIAEQLHSLASPNEALFYTSGRVTNEPAYMYQLMVRLYGTNNLPDCSNMCHEPTSVMLGKQLGVGKSTVVLEDFEKAKLILIFGQNPATNHPRMLEMLAHAHDQGCRIISINPMREQGLDRFRNPQKITHMVAGGSNKMVDEVIQIQIGGDAALLTGMAKWLIDHDKINHPFIDQHTSGYQQFAHWVQTQSWSDITLASGIEQSDIENLARLVADSPRTICTWGMGITQHVQGEDNVAMITNLLLLMGMIGIEGAGASPVRGHSNVQGDRTMGIHDRPNPELLKSLESFFDITLPKDNGYDVVQGAKALIEGKLKAFVSMGGNYSVAAPDNDAIQHALTQNVLNVFVATKLNETMLYPGDNNIILPCLSRTERYVTPHGEQFATIEDSICQIVPTKGSLNPVSRQLKSESQIIAGMANHLFGETSPIDWKAMSDSYDVVRDYVSQTIEGFENFNERIRKNKRGFHLYHPARHHEWKTESKKAQFEVPSYPITYVANEMTDMSHSLQNRQGNNQDNLNANKHTEQAGQAVWQFTSVRSHTQFNTIIFGHTDRYRQTTRRDVLFMHPDEISRMGWMEGDQIKVMREDSLGNRRSLGPLILTKMDISANSVAGYYPESNQLMDLEKHAPESRIPNYKSVTVELHNMSQSSAA